MDTTRATATESLGESQPGPSREIHVHTPTSTVDPPFIKVHRRTVFSPEQGKDIDLFTISIADETIELLPLRNWGQLDLYKWRARGKLPNTPPGLEITSDHVKLTGETVKIDDPDGCNRLEHLFSEWLAMEKHAAELARQKANSKPAVAAPATAPAEPQPLRYSVQIDKAGQVHVRCVQGKDTLAAIGLNTAGFQSLFTQGLMKKPKALHVGALHDWVELDGVMFSFEKGNDDSEKLAHALNEKYLPQVSLGGGKDVVVFSNAASSTGFDIQFPVSVGGLTTVKRRPLDEQSLELLQDPVKSGLLHRDIVIKISRPNLVFKKKTPDGGERYLDSTAANQVLLTNEDGEEHVIDLSKPVNYLHLSTGELAAVLNHPAIHQHGKTAARSAEPATPAPAPATRSPAPTAPATTTQQPPLVPAEVPAPARTVATATSQALAQPVAREVKETPAEPKPPVAPPSVPKPPPDTPPKPRVNSWLKLPLSKPSIRHDWLACTVYSEIAERFGNSTPGKLGLSDCWSVTLSSTNDPAHPDFKGFFLTQKGGFGFLNQGRMVRFNKGVAFLGTQESALQGIDVALLGVGIDVHERAVFIVQEPYRNKFGVPPPAVQKELNALSDCGILVLGANEVLEAPDAIEIAWTVPKEQASADDIRADEHIRPEPNQDSGAAEEPSAS